MRLDTSYPHCNVYQDDSGRYWYRMKVKGANGRRILTDVVGPFISWTAAAEDAADTLELLQFTTRPRQTVL